MGRGDVRGEGLLGLLDRPQYGCDRGEMHDRVDAAGQCCGDDVRVGQIALEEIDRAVGVGTDIEDPHICAAVL